ncbi:PREDICTED: probable inactive dual specificity protein phosphatase-like At4g18593 [Camelina sativa]|uniref:Probable inactive dual specificity protein phosphatase-like At4g18593 n=1 Tax=Camelina sativa TaxID=90675 RepID=A0ABM0U1M1_CAMSA|nr:PREDICTED: probable inactive dual specificity protein phosphatase-like At4g18593 [Camelina sativa]
MDTTSPAVFVNGALLRRYIGQKVRAVIQVIRSDIGSVVGKSTDDQQIVVKGSPQPPLTAYLEVIGIAESDNTICADVWTNFGDSFDAQNYNELCKLANAGAMTEVQMEMEIETNSSLQESVPKPQVIYRCKKCRRIVAVEENVVPHEPGKGEECFAWKKRSGNPEHVQCSSIFVEPMKWMQTIHDGLVEEKLLCFGCNGRLGYFNWSGMQCSCGAWVNPAFQLNKSRIDECKSEPNPNLKTETG